MDMYRPTYHYVAALLERGVQALIYVGKYDWICNHVGNEAWTTELEWSGREEFAKQPLKDWSVDGKTPAGSTRSAKGLTFLTIEGAGHLVSRSLILLRWREISTLLYRCLMISQRSRWRW
jgi:carboxypeptidase C (cathepsin A)